jgi:hypothetical protein
MPPLMFAVESAESRALPLSAQRLINCFVEKQEAQSKSPIPLFGAPGMDVFAKCGTGPVRGMWSMNGLVYVVSGQSLYSVDQNAFVVNLGSGIGGTAPVSMSDNGTQLCIVNGGAGWIYTVGGGLQPITSEAFYPAKTVNFFDGYFVFDRAGTNEYFLSALYDGTTFNGLDFASAEALPDVVQACPQNLQLLFVMCEQHIELWYDAGTNDFPFQRYAGGVINYGCIASATVVNQDGALFFLGTDKIFYRLQANQPLRISTHALEHVLAEDPDLAQAFCFTHTIEGHKLIYLMLPASNRTFVFDVSTGKWHERDSWDASGNPLGRWRGNCVIEAYQSILVGDAFDGTICKVDWNTFTERGNTMRMLAHSAPLHANRKRLFVSLLELDVQAGQGAASGQGSNPQVMLRVSKDGGVTWGNYQRWSSMGVIGRFLQRVRWLRLGSGRQFVFEITITDPVRRTIISTNCDYTVGV